MTENILRNFPLKELHNTYGVNWEQKESIKCYKHNGKFTIKELVKEFDLDLYDLIIITVQYTDWSKYTSKGTIVLDKGLTTYSLPSFSGFYSKKYFEEVRKKDDITVYIVAVDRSTLVSPKKHERSIWNLTRFTDDINTRFIYKPAKHELFHNGYRYSTYRDRREDIEFAIDKSGYPVFAKRRQLKSKLAVVHEENLGKVLNTAFNKDNSELFNRIMQVKNNIAEEIKKVSTRDELHGLCRALSEVEDLMKRYERHIRNLQKTADPNTSIYEKYGSIKEVKDELNEMNAELEEITN